MLQDSLMNNMSTVSLPFQTKLIDEFSNLFKKGSYHHKHQLIASMLSLHVESNLQGKSFSLYISPNICNPCIGTLSTKIAYYLS